MIPSAQDRYRTVQKYLKTKPLGMGVWEYVGRKNRPYAHTPILNPVPPEHSRSRSAHPINEVVGRTGGSSLRERTGAQMHIEFSRLV